MPGTDGPKSTIGALVLSAAARFPNDDYAVTLENRLTYADLERLTGLAARHLLDLGVAKGMRVGLLVEGGRDWFVWWLGALRIGALTAPLSTLYTPRELAKVLRLADVDTLIVPTVLFGKDTGKLLENAVHGLADWEERQLRLPSVPYLRRIVMLGDSERKWSTSIDLESDPSLPQSCLRNSRSRFLRQTSRLSCTLQVPRQTPKGSSTRMARFFARPQYGTRPLRSSPGFQGDSGFCSQCRSSGSAAFLARSARCTRA